MKNLLTTVGSVCFVNCVMWLLWQSGGAAGAAQAQAAPPKPASVECTELSLVDGDRVVRANLSLVDGVPTFVMNDIKGKRSIRLRVLKDGPECEMFGEDQEKVWVHCRAGVPSVRLTNTTGFTHSKLYIDKGVPTLELDRGTGKSVDSQNGMALLQVTEHGGDLRLLGRGDERSKAQVTGAFVAGVGETGRAVAATYDKDNNVVWQVP